MGSAVVLEVDHLTISGNDGVGVLAVKDLAATGHRLWSAQEGIALADLPEVTLWLIEPPDILPTPRARSRAISWDAQTARIEVIRSLAECWWEATRGGGPEQTAVVWQIDALAVSLLVHLEPLIEEQWMQAAGVDPLPGKILSQSGGPGARRLMAQRWLYREWWLAERTASASALDAETRWAVYFHQHRQSPRGPFLSLDASEKRLRALGRMNVRLRGEETRVWIHELPLDQRNQWREHWRTREAHLRALLPRMHPVYHRAAVALAGGLAPGPSAASFREAFHTAWGEAQATALEIRDLLDMQEIN